MAGKKVVKRVTKPKKEIDIPEVERLAGLGLSQEEIAYSLGIASSTLYNHKLENGEIGEAIKRGKASAHGMVSNQLVKLCGNGNIAAIIWYEKTRRGMSDKVNISVTELDNSIERELARLTSGSQDRDAEASQAEVIH